MPTSTRQGTGERGTTTTQVAVLFPALLIALMLVVQYAYWHHAKQVAVAAAAEAVDAAQALDADAAAGEAEARAFLAQSGGLNAPVVRVERDTDRVVAEIEGAAPRLVPGLAWSVTARAEGAVERFVPVTER